MRRLTRKFLCQINRHKHITTDRMRIIDEAGNWEAIIVAYCLDCKRFWRFKG